MKYNKELSRTIVWDGTTFQKLVKSAIEDCVEVIKITSVNNFYDLLEMLPHNIWEILNDELKNGDYKKAIQKVRIEIE